LVVNSKTTYVWAYCKEGIAQEDLEKWENDLQQMGGGQRFFLK
jgi:hypothetical protein